MIEAVLLGAPVPASLETIAFVVLSFVPAVVAVTATEKVQDDPRLGEAVKVPPDKPRLLLPAIAVMVPLPQEPVMFGVAAMTSPAGRLSVKPTPVRPLVVLGLSIVNVNVLMAFSGMLAGLNAFVIVGLKGIGFTVTTIGDDGGLVHPFVVVVTV